MTQDMSEVGAGMEDWSVEDKEWIGQVPEQLRALAIEHGRRIFVLVMQTGQIGEALTAVGQLNHEMPRAAAQHIGTVLNQLVTDYVGLIGGDAVRSFVECKAEADRILRQEAPRIQVVRH